MIVAAEQSARKVSDTRLFRDTRIPARMINRGE